MVQNVLHWQDTKTSWVEKAYIWLLAGMLFAIALHAPISVGFGTLWPDAALLIKSWKEIILGVAGLLLVVILTKRRQWTIFKSKLFYLIIGFALLNLALVPLFYTGPEGTLAGLLINLRYLFAFSLLYAAVRLFPKTVPLFLTALAAGAAVVIIFALLQLTVLPHDILRSIGYGETTIMPYLMVDQNMDFIRINSTMRGPNPLGAYLVVVLGLLLAVWLQGPKRIKQPVLWMIFIGGLGAAVIMWATYSRSAALGALTALGIVVLVAYGRRITRGVWIAVALVALVLAGSLVAARDTSFVSNVILHEDPQEGSATTSNDQHAESLGVGLKRMAAQPLGGGIGSTGSASLLTDEPIVIENQYLFIAHEVGWPGLALFILINASVLGLLWKQRKQWLSLGVFATGVGLALIGFIQPVWVDDTVSIVWWSLAGIALAAGVTVKRKGGKHV